MRQFPGQSDSISVILQFVEPALIAGPVLQHMAMPNVVLELNVLASHFPRITSAIARFCLNSI
ncbi:hypothetical protein KZX70_26920 [Paenibacillus silvae]|uniref:hypothetical protein n=1 Tax=Paenibacillus silvae TaxID=1325358 RepID=UPI001642D368|nr:MULTISPECIES: hypothetical protein [Paenibacillus]MCK6078472.1 hypothetical protein [Paenibacillus silvae]